ncbi:MAG: hypothetical protein ATN36_04625 [Epulopiscium sp. Nele67-Bin005]|nr:MAG: hypothetical protein ATN36_04625 [Epulopiscium sp. Nele67-Bin005]
MNNKIKVVVGILSASLVAPNAIIPTMAVTESFSASWIDDLTATKLIELAGEDAQYNTLIIANALKVGIAEQISTLLPISENISVNLNVTIEGKVTINNVIVDGEELIESPIIIYVAQFKEAQQKLEEQLQALKYDLTPNPAIDEGTLPPITVVTNPFTDISDTEWFYYDVMNLYVNNLVDGYTNNTFAPEKDVTRAEVVTILQRLENGTNDQSSTFSDVSSSAWYAGAVGWAVKSGIVEGFPDGEFEPNADVTREQLATMLYNLAGKPQSVGTGISTFVDADQITWAKNAMNWAVNEKILDGNLKDELEPQKFATRAEMCAMITRFMNLYHIE